MVKKTELEKSKEQIARLKEEKNASEGKLKEEQNRRAQQQKQHSEELSARDAEIAALRKQLAESELAKQLREEQNKNEELEKQKREEIARHQKTLNKKNKTIEKLKKENEELSQKLSNIKCINYSGFKFSIKKEVDDKIILDPDAQIKLLPLELCDKSDLKTNFDVLTKVKANKKAEEEETFLYTHLPNQVKFECNTCVQMIEIIPFVENKHHETCQVSTG